MPESGQTALRSQLPVLQDFSSLTAEKVVDLLNDCFRGKWGTVDYWKWKHSSRPGFRDRDVKVYIEDDEPIASFHVKRTPFQLSPGLVVDASMEGDIAVAPSHRGQRLIDDAHVAIGQELFKDGVVLRIGWTSPELFERYYKKRFGHLMLSTPTKRYRKILSTEHLTGVLREALENTTQQTIVKRLLQRRPLQIVLVISGFDPIMVSLSDSHVSCKIDSGAEPADFSLSLPYGLVAAARGRRLSLLRRIAIAIVRGEMRSRNLLRTLFRCLADLVH